MSLERQFFFQWLTREKTKDFLQSQNWKFQRSLPNIQFQSASWVMNWWYIQWLSTFEFSTIKPSLLSFRAFCKTHRKMTCILNDARRKTSSFLIDFKTLFRSSISRRLFKKKKLENWELWTSNRRQQRRTATWILKKRTRTKPMTLLVSSMFLTF